jgi:hypothetical protein
MGCPFNHTLSRALAVVALLCAGRSQANHFSGADISYQCLGGDQYLVTLDLFRDCTGFMMVPQTLTFTSDCGSNFSVNNIPVTPGTEVSQLCSSQLGNSSCNGGALPGIEHYVFQTTVNLPACSNWTISWNICCRNSTVNLNGAPGMYVEAVLDDATAPCNNSPVFNDQSIPYVCVNQPVFYNYGVTEPDGDSLVYSLINARFYAPPPTSITYNPGFTGASPIPGVTLDPATGQLVFTPTLIGNYVVVVLVEEYDSMGNLIGTVMRDQMFVVLNCTGSVPVTAGLTNNTGGLLTSPNSIAVCDGESFCVDVVFSDPDAGTTLQVISNALLLLPGATFTVSGTNPATATLCWTGDAANSPVNVLVTADDGACPVENTASTSINIITDAGSSVLDPGLNGNIAICANSGPVDLFNSLGGTPDVGGVWLDPNGNSHSGLFDPSVDGAGNYTYIVGNACGNASADVTVSILAAPDAGTNGTLTLCSTGPATPMFNSLGGTPQAGGSWTAPGGGAHGANYNPAVDAPGVYTYTVTSGGACGNSSATVTVSEVAPPNAGTNGTLALCSTGPATVLFNSLGGTPQAGGSWTAPGGGAHGPNYNPAVDGPGVYTYTVVGTAPCPSASATVTVNEILPPNAGTNGNLTLCSSSAATGLFASLGGGPGAGGTWTAPGGAPHSSTYDPAVDAPGVYTYTVLGTAPCPNASATVTVVENASPNAGSNGSLTLCSSSAATGLFASLGGGPAAGGTWTAPGGGPHSSTYDPAVDGPGVYTYTVLGTAPCPNSSATVTVIENAPPNAGINGNLTLCTSSVPTVLFASLGGGPAAGGTWTAPGGGPHSGTYDPAVDAPGVYTYTVLGTAPCPNASATVTVVENASPNAGTNGSLTLCSSSAATGLFASLGGGPAAGGTWTAPGGGPHSSTYDPAVDGPGVYTYTVLGTAPCPNSSATVTVVENVAANAGTNGNLALCSSSAPTGLFASLGGGPAAGGTWTAPGGGPHTGIYDPAVDAPGVYTYTVLGTAPCPNASATVTVAESAAPNAGTNGNLALCSTSAATGLFAALGGGPAAGGTWTAPGGGPHSGTYDPGVDMPGIYTYTVLGTAPCPNASATVTVLENAAANAGINGSLSLCSTSVATALFASLGGVPDAGGLWTAPGGGPHSGTYDPTIDVPGVYTYTVLGTAPCPSASATVTVTESTAPNAGINGNLALCSSSAATGLLVSLGGAPDAGGAWTAPGGGPHSGTYDPAVDGPGVYTYTVIGTSPCTNASATVTVTENVAPSAGTNGNLTLCSSSVASVLLASLGGAPDPGGAWTAPGGGPHSGTYDPALDGPGIYTYTVIGTAPCPNASATVMVTENVAPNAGNSANLTLCSSSAATGLFAALSGGPDVGGTWGRTRWWSAYRDLRSLRRRTRYLHLHRCWHGTLPQCDRDHNSDRERATDAGIDGSITLCDQGAATGLFASLGGSPDAGGSWTAPGGGPFSGTYDPLSDNAGVYTYTVSGTAPCPNDQATVTVTETGSPNAGTDGATTLCSSSAPTSLFALLGGADPGGTWTAPGGGPHSGTLDPSTDPAGAYTYTLAAIAPCAGDQSIVTVTINAAPDAGVDGVITLCDQGAATGLFASLGGSQMWEALGPHRAADPSAAPTILSRTTQACIPTQ